MRSVSLARINQRVVNYCNHCKKSCKCTPKYIRLIYNEYRSAKGARIDFYCSNNNLMDFVLHPKKEAKKRANKD